MLAPRVHSNGRPTALPPATRASRGTSGEPGRPRHHRDVSGWPRSRPRSAAARIRRHSGLRAGRAERRGDAVHDQFDRRYPPASSSRRRSTRQRNPGITLTPCRGRVGRSRHRDRGTHGALDHAAKLAKIARPRDGDHAVKIPGARGAAGGRAVGGAAFAFHAAVRAVRHRRVARDGRCRRCEDSGHQLGWGPSPDATRGGSRS